MKAKSKKSLPDALVAEWSPRNTSPALNFTEGSGCVAWWLGQCGHEWQAVIKNRTKGDGCPFCSGAKVLDGFNDLLTTHPEIAKEWSSKNATSISEISYGSVKKCLWECSIGHEWYATPNSRTNGGTGCPICSGRQVLVGYNDLYTIFPEIASEALEDPKTFTKHSGQRIWWQCSSGHKWYAKIADRTMLGSGCPVCAHGQVSAPENELAEFVSTITEIKRHDRTLISPKELDIYVPSKKIAIEFNGLYWHTEEKVGRTYHYDKWLACKNAGVQLIQIWEDDWKHKNNIARSLIRTKISGRPSLGARHTEVKSDIDVKDFINDNHLQGYVGGQHKLSLIHDNELVAAAVIGSTGEVRRYCSTLSVVGGLDKLLSASGLTTFYTFADHCVSNGDLYEKTGWSRRGELPPDYKYVVNDRREHKFNYRIKRFEKDNSLVFYEGKTERELAMINRLPRVYDSGKTKYEKSLDRLKTAQKGML